MNKNNTNIKPPINHFETIKNANTGIEKNKAKISKDLEELQSENSKQMIQNKKTKSIKYIRPKICSVLQIIGCINFILVLICMSVIKTTSSARELLNTYSGYNSYESSSISLPFSTKISLTIGSLIFLLILFAIAEIIDQQAKIVGLLNPDLIPMEHIEPETIPSGFIGTYLSDVKQNTKTDNTKINN